MAPAPVYASPPAQGTTVVNGQALGTYQPGQVAITGVQPGGAYGLTGNQTAYVQPYGQQPTYGSQYYVAQRPQRPSYGSQYYGVQHPQQPTYGSQYYSVQHPQPSYGQPYLQPRLYSSIRGRQ
jgi:hypothetical protein